MNTAELLGGRYRIVKPLGGGGMKSVYLAEDLKLSSRLCAVAAMIDNFANPDEQQVAIAAFQREADMLAALRNDHIPQIYDKFSDQQSHYLVMEFVEGDTLENRVKAAGGRLGERETIDIAIQILDTLEYLHGLNPPVIYRDMKPGNVMVTPDGKVKLIDFGIARFFQTSTVTLMGTPGYAPREQYMGKVEERSDLYALAATLHQALSGRAAVPFDFPALIQLVPGTNPDLSGVLAKALADRVEDRIPSAREFKARLLAIRAAMTATPPAPAPVVPGDQTAPLRKTATQPDSQTWVIADTSRVSGSIGQNVPPASRNLGGPARNAANDPTAVMNRVPGAQSAALASLDPDLEQTAILQRRPAGSDLGPGNQTWVIRDTPPALGANRRSGLKVVVGFVTIAALGVAAFAGVSQWNEIQHQKELVAAHEQYERQQQAALEAAERQQELLRQQQLQAQQDQAQREAELRRRQLAEREERRRWRTQHQPPPPGPYSNQPVAQASPADNGTDTAIAAGVAGALGGVVGGLLGGAFSHSGHHAH